MSLLAIMGVSVRRVLRDRLSLFFIVILPILVILIIGASVRGFSTFRVGVVEDGSGASGRQLTATLSSTPGMEVRQYATAGALEAAVRRSVVQAGLVLPTGMDQAVQGHDEIDVGLVAEPANPTQQAAATAVQSVLARYAGQVQAARFTTEQVGGEFGTSMALAGHLSASVPAVAVVSRQAGTQLTSLPEGFSYSAPTMLVLFVFLNSLAGSAVIIANRRLGMYDRMLAGPVRSGTVIAGEALGFVTIALAQAVLIIAIGAVVFGVSWGNPLAAAALVGVWALVGAGAGMLAGTLFSTPEQATAVGPALGIAFAMLGGCMWPLSIVGPTMRTVGHFTPQAWAVDAWTRLLSQHGTVASIAPQLLVLGAFAASFLALAAWRLRRRLA
ncbi:MAG TPA: ABC transporter permease [Acidimicrobiales bacterium]|jgi:ABC-2 type transport system permease protein|nr:ABC transporter permease [Acidimicrobiales bacterium]